MHQLVPMFLQEAIPCHDTCIPALYARWDKLIEARAAPLKPAPGEKCAVMHVRRGDALLNTIPGSNMKQFVNVSLGTYIDYAKPWLDHKNITDIILMTDDSDALFETRSFPKYKWRNMDRKRFQTAAGVKWEVRV